MRRGALVGAGIVLLGGWLFGIGASAQTEVSCAQATITWDGGAGTESWHDAANWDAGRVPGSADIVCIPASGGELTVVHATGVTTIRSLAAEETLQVSAGTLNLTNNISPLAGLRLTGGQIGGAGSLTVTESFEWTSGTVTGSGILRLAPGSEATISGGSTKRLLEGRTLSNEATINWVGTGSLTMGRDTTWENNGLLDFGANTSINWDGIDPVARFDNLPAGLVRKTAGTGTSAIDVPFDNRGTVESHSGTLAVSSGPSGIAINDTGTYLAGDGGTLEFSGSGSRTIAAPASLDAADGTVAFTGGSAAVSVPLPAAELRISGGGNVFSGVVSVGSLVVSGGSSVLEGSSGASSIVVSGGTAALEGTEAPATLVFSGGTLEGSGPVEVGEEMLWTAGTLRGDGLLRVSPAATLSIEGFSTKTLRDGRLLRTEGETVWEQGSMTAGEDARWENVGVLDIEGNVSLFWSFGDPPVVHNTGTVRRSVGTGTATVNGVFENDGVTDVVSGTLRVASGGSPVSVTDTGSYLVGSGATLEFFGSGARTLTAVSTVGGTGGTVHVSEGANAINAPVSAGELRISGGGNVFSGALSVGSLVVSGGSSVLEGSSGASSIVVSRGTAALEGAEAPATLVFSGGTIEGSGSVAVAEEMLWTAGTLRGGGTVRVLPAGSLSIEGFSTKTLRGGRVLRTEGEAVWELGSMTAGEDARWENVGVLDIEGNVSLFWSFGDAPVVHNTGTVRRSVGTGTATVNGVFENDGVTEVVSGTLRVGSGGSGASLTDTGSYLVAEDATLEFLGSGSRTLTAASTVGGTGGAVLISGGTNLFDGPFGAGVLAISGGNNAFSGIVSVGSLVVSGGSSVLEGSSGASSMVVSGGTTALEGAEAPATVVFSGGAIEGSGPVAVGEEMLWTAGTLRGDGLLDILPTAGLSIEGTSTKTLRGGRTLRTRGVASWTGGTITSGEAVFWENTGTLEIAVDRSLTWSFGTIADFRNTGTLLRASEGSTDLNAAFENHGTVSVGEGTLAVFSGSSGMLVEDTGSYGAGPGATLEFIGSGTRVLTPASQLAAPEGTIRMRSGTVQVNPPAVAGTFHQQAGTLTFLGSFTGGRIAVTGGTGIFDGPAAAATLTQSGGTLDGVGTLTATAVTWTGGTARGSGTTVVPEDGTLAIRGFSTLRGGRTLQLDGSGVWGSSNLTVFEGAELRNTGSLDIQGDFTASGCCPVGLITNSGTITKTVGTASGGLLISVPVENTGTIRTLEGRIRLNSGGAGRPQTGLFEAAEPGTRIDFDSGTFSLTPEARLVGHIGVTGASVTVGSPIDLEDLLLSSGTLTLATTGEVSHAEAFRMTGGTLGGDAHLETAALTWSGGTMTGGGTTRVGPDADALLEGGSLRGDRLLLLEGDAVWGAGNIDVRDRSELRNTGAIEVHGDRSFTGFSAQGMLANAGEIIKIAGTGDLSINFPLQNTGTIRVLSGGLRLAGGEADRTQTGVFDAAGPGTRIDFTSRDYTLAPEARLEGDVAFTGATVTLESPFALEDMIISSGTVTMAAGEPSEATTLRMTGGTLTGDGSLEIGSRLTWTGGTIRGAGSLRVPDGATAILGGGTLRDDRLLLLEGDTAWGSGSISFFEDAELRNTGSFEIHGDFTLFASATRGLLTNTGTITKIAGTGASDLRSPLANSGTIRSLSGRILLSGGDAGIPQIGAFEATRPGARIDFNSGSFTIDPDAELIGAFAVTGAAVEAEQPLNLPDLRISSGSLTLSDTRSPSRVARMTMTGGTLAGPAPLMITESLTWSGGTMRDPGTTAIPFDAELRVNGTVSLTDARALVNQGRLVWGAGSLSLFERSVLYNSGSMEIHGDFSSSTTCCGREGRLVNTGTLSKVGGSGRLSISAPIENEGTIRVLAGELHLSGGIANYSDGALLGGTYELEGTLRIQTDDVTLNGATVILRGPEAALIDRFAQDAFRNLRLNNVSGVLALHDGASLATTEDLLNEGMLRIEGGSAVAAAAYLQTAGQTILGTGSSLAAPVELAGGILAGSGIVDGTLTNTAGSVEPDGVLSLGGDYAQGEDATLRVDLLGGGNHDRLDIAGTASLDGLLRVAVNMELPVDGLEFPLIGYDAREGAFDRVEAEMGSFLFEQIFETGEMILAVTPIPAGGLSIDDDAEATNSRQVTLRIEPPEGFTQMRIANEAAPSGAWESVATEVPWTLADADGTRSVFAQFRDDRGRESTLVSASITLDRVPPEATIRAPAGPAADTVVLFSEDVRGVGSANVVIRLAALGENLPATITCANALGTEVDCTRGQVRSVRLTPAAPLVPGVSYVVTVNPGGAAPIADAAGNAAATVSKEIRLPAR